MSSNNDPPKNIVLPSNLFNSQNPFINSPSPEKKENSSQRIIITKNNNQNSTENDNIKQANNIKEKVIEEVKRNEYEMFLRDKLGELKEISNNELRQTCKEYYLISRQWMIKLNDFIKRENNIKFEDLKDKKDNDEFLIEKEKLSRALTLNGQDKDKMVILKPKYAFAFTLRPCPVNKSFWEFINKNLGLEPEVKDYAEPIEHEDGSITYKRVYCKYVKINVIILPQKRDYSNENNSYDFDYNSINSL